MTSFDNIKISTINVSKAIEIEKSLEYTLTNFKDLILEIKQFNSDSSHNYKSQFLTQKEKCERKSCVGAEAMKTIIESKNNIMKIVVTVLRKFYDTKNLNILDEIFELCGESSPSRNRNNIEANEKNEPKIEDGLPPVLSPKKEPLTADNMMIHDESISEIEGTPTGRTSPILKSKIFRSVTCTSSPDVRDKKKCPNSWPTPEKKAIKLLQNTPKRKETSKSMGKPSSGRLRQSRLNLMRSKQHSVVDLTSSPEFGGGARGGAGEGHIGRLNIKREPIDKDETTLPPTTPNGHVTLVFKTAGSPKKAQKTSPASKHIKMEDETRIDDVETKENCLFGGGMDNGTDIEDSINILRAGFRFPSDVTRQAAMRECEIRDDDVTHCDVDSGASLLELMAPAVGAPPHGGNRHSPIKSPLVENINASNCAGGAGAGAGVGGCGRGTLASDSDQHKRKSPVKVEPLYKEPTVRKKAEKMALPGWSCEECEKFWGELYKDEPAMLAKKMALCSKHRGRQNPARPRTPPGFWHPRWDVPDDTEEFNRRNNAL